ncbi:MAG: ATP-binding protein [Oscillospiraceae bacterium]|nr:ATP-binding protein [Oscillospiraceae bacterium]
MENRPKIYMVCGISASGKSCFSKQLALYGIPRISLDEELWPDFYVLKNMMSTEHRAYLYSEAQKRIKAKIANFCREGRACSIDMPFCKKKQRDEYRAHITENGGEPVLIWIKTDLPVLKARLLDRIGKNGPDNLPVSEEEIEMYWHGFEKPEDESAIIIDGERDFDIENFLKTV